MADGVTGVVTLSPEEGERVRGAAVGLGDDAQFDDITPVSYTHLTLPTNREV